MDNNPIQAKKDKKMKGESGSDSVAKALKELGPYMGLGSVLAVSTGAGTVGGVYLDRWLETGPWLTLAGIILGIAIGFIAVFQTLAAQERHRRKPGGD
jgi:ATP synthase protein I